MAQSDVLSLSALPLEKLLDLYDGMVRARETEDRLETLFKQGHIKGGVYRSLGQEAGSVGAAYALRRRTDGTGSGGDFDATEFSENGHVIGYWLNHNEDNGQGDAGTWPDLKVLFLQTSVAQGLSVDGTIVLIIWEDPATGDLIAEADIPAACAATCGSCPTDSDGDGDTDAMDLAVLLGNWGPIDAGHCLDSDANGLIGPFDLAVLLGAWGPCP